MLVAQKDLSGCAVACVAGLLGITYTEALHYFDKPHNARFVGFYCNEIVKVLRQAGIESASWRYVKYRLRQKIYQKGTIVFIARSDKYPFGHYLIRVEDGWMDPWINFPSVGVAQAGIRKRLPGRPIYAVFINRFDS